LLPLFSQRFHARYTRAFTRKNPRGAYDVSRHKWWISRTNLFAHNEFAARSRERTWATRVLRAAHDAEEPGHQAGLT
jgi:hypothetical protein